MTNISYNVGDRIVDSDQIYVIFKIEVGNVQPSGNYQNTVTYITTAQF